MIGQKESNLCFLLLIFRYNLCRFEGLRCATTVQMAYCNNAFCALAPLREIHQRIVQINIPVLCTFCSLCCLLFYKYYAALPLGSGAAHR